MTPDEELLDDIDYAVHAAANDGALTEAHARRLVCALADRLDLDVPERYRV